MDFTRTFKEVTKIQELEDKATAALYYIITVKCFRSYNLALIIRLRFGLKPVYIISKQYIKQNSSGNYI